jgi:hypothetical protein
MYRDTHDYVFCMFDLCYAHICQFYFVCCKLGRLHLLSRRCKYMNRRVLCVQPVSVRVRLAEAALEGTLILQLQHAGVCTCLALTNTMPCWSAHALHICHTCTCELRCLRQRQEPSLHVDARKI